MNFTPDNLLTDPVLAINCTELSQRVLEVNITTQADADIVENCYDRTGDMNHGLNIVISPAARGTIRVTTAYSFTGDLLVENSLSLEKLLIDRSSSWPGFKSATVRKLSNLTGLHFHVANTNDDKARMKISLLDLPELETVNFDMLTRVMELKLVKFLL